MIPARVEGFAFAADWHVDASAWKHSGVAGDSYWALSQIVDACISGRLALVAPGDLFDSPRPGPEDEYQVRRQMQRMRVAELPVYYTQAQHDRARGRTRMGAIHSWPTHVHGRRFAAAGLELYGLDWQPMSALAGALAAVPRGVDALACHQVWRELMGGQAACEGSLSQSPCPLVFTGDFHRHLAVEFARPGGPPGVAYSSGSIAMRSIDEDEDKAFFVVRPGPVVASAPLRSRKVARYAVGSEDDLSRLLAHGLALLAESAAAHAEGLPPELAAPLVHVRAAAELPGAKARLRAACAGWAHLFFRPHDAGPASQEGGADALPPGAAEAIAAAVGAEPFAALPGPERARARDELARLTAAAHAADALDQICDEA